MQRLNKHGSAALPHPPSTVAKGLNFYLNRANEAIRVTGVRQVDANFHARHDAVGRTYRYFIVHQKKNLKKSQMDQSEMEWNIPSTDLFHRDNSWVLANNSLDLDSMSSVLQLLKGTHDFSSFRSAGCGARSPVKTLHDARLDTVTSNTFLYDNQEKLSVTLTANGFLYHQVTKTYKRFIVL